MTKINPYDDRLNKGKNEVYDEFKPFILEIKVLNDLLCCTSYNSDINIVAKIGDVVKIIIDVDATKEAILKILLETSDKFVDNCFLIDKAGNKLAGSSIRCYIKYVPNNLLISDNSSIINSDKPIIIFDEPHLFSNGKAITIFNSTIKLLIKNHIVLVFTKLNKNLGLNEITIELCSYDKAKIDEDIIYNL